MDDCLFCRIAKGEVGASRVYEDAEVMAFLDARPVSEGHTLVIPKKHYGNIFEMPEEKLAEVFKVVKRVASAIMESEQAGGIRIVQNNGSAAHQIIFHFHVHIIPEYAGRSSSRPREISQQSELERVAAKIKRLM